jgi:hypothetical protein
VGLYSTSGFINQTIRVIASCGIPFRMLDNIEFRKFIELARKAPPTRDLPFISSRRINRHLMTFAEDGRQRALQAFHAAKSKISIALDGWGSPNKKDFLAVTG